VSAIAAGVFHNMTDFSLWLDEEDLLGFNVFVAELELIGGGSKRPDNVALLEVLQKLVASINTTDRAVLKSSQKRCEALLVDVIYKGACAPVRPPQIRAWQAILAGSSTPHSAARHTAARC
jgi:hypothetical protein